MANGIGLEIVRNGGMKIGILGVLWQHCPSGCGSRIVHLLYPGLALAVCAFPISMPSTFFLSLWCSTRPLSDPQYSRRASSTRLSKVILMEYRVLIKDLEAIRDEKEMTGTMGIKMGVHLVLVVHALNRCR